MAGKKILWSGRFEKSPKEIVFNYMSEENIRFDSRLVKYDILGSIAHVKMLFEQMILKKNESNEIINALKKVLNKYETGKFQLKKELEDVHMNVEVEVTKITRFGKKMHTARSRNDQIGVDIRLYLREELLQLANLIIKLQKSFVKLGKQNVALPSYTHTRVAQPITSSFWCESYVQSFERDIERLFDVYKKINRSPLGACAISGTSWKINRKKTAELLGFDSVIENEMDAINQRGELEAEVLFVLSELMAKFSRFAEEVIWLSEKEIIKISDEYTTGSSIMPNKKNPDALELVRGRTGRIFGNLIHALVVQKGLMNGHNADTQETKVLVMNALDNTKETIALLIKLVPALEFDEKTAIHEIKKGYGNATELADLLAMNGVPFRDAHEKVGKMVTQLIKENRYIEDIGAKKIKEMLNLDINEQEIERAIQIKKERFVKEIKLNEKWAEKIAAESKKINSVFQKLTLASRSP